MNLEGLPYTLAPMTLDDVPTVAELEQVIFTLPWSANAFSYELRHNPSAEYLVLRYAPWIIKDERPLPRSVKRLLGAPRLDPSILGYGGFWLMLDEAHICTLGVRPEWRGRGLGELLLAALMERALARQAHVITLEVRVTNLTAQNLYRKYGFQVVGQRKRYYSDNGEDALIMTTEPVDSPSFQERFHRLTDVLLQRLLTQSQTLSLVAAEDENK